MTQATQAVELSHLAEPDALTEPLRHDDEQLNISALPPTDTGAGAWKFLAGCFLVEALLWGEASLSLSLIPQAHH